MQLLVAANTKFHSSMDGYDILLKEPIGLDEKQMAIVHKAIQENSSIYATFTAPQSLKELTWSTYDICKVRRSVFHPVIVKIAEQISKFFLQHYQVLEIGSGIIEKENSTSYGASLFAKYVSSWDYSDNDYTASAIVNSSKKEIKNYFSFNLAQPLLPTDPLRKKQYECIFGSNVLDVLPFEQWPQAFENINDLLKPDGIFVHVADLTPYPIACLDAHTNSNSILFPYISASRKIGRGFRIINKEDYWRILQENDFSLTDQERAFFNEWGSLACQFQYLKISKHLRNVDLLKVSQRVKNLFGKSIQSISFEESFKTRLRQLANNYNWTIIHSEALTSSMMYSDPINQTDNAEMNLKSSIEKDAYYPIQKIKEKLDTKENAIGLIHGAILPLISEQVPSNSLLLKSEVGVFVARKKSIPEATPSEVVNI